MTDQVCKAASCPGGCLDAIVVDNFRELTEVAIQLVVTGNLSEEQMDDIIDLYTRYEDEVTRRIEVDTAAQTKLKAIIGV